MPELVALEHAPPSPAKPKGFYEELLQSRPEALYLDASTHPEKYEEGVLDLATELVQKKRKLGAEERELLDRAVLNFLEAPKKNPPTIVREKKASAPIAAGDEADDFEDAAPAIGTDPPAFWWV